MSNLRSRSTEYARSCGVEILVTDGPDDGRYLALLAGPVVVVGLNADTANGPHCGEVVYRACKALMAAKQLKITILPSAKNLMAS